VVLVVLERADAQQHLFLDYFFLLTNAPAEDVDALALLERYRQRGEAERDFGDWKSTLEVSLSSAPRPKAHYRGRAIQEDEPDSERLGDEDLARFPAEDPDLRHAASLEVRRIDRVRQILGYFRSKGRYRFAFFSAFSTRPNTCSNTCSNT
jgi:hypothetical protein